MNYTIYIFRNNNKVCEQRLHLCWGYIGLYIYIHQVFAHGLPFFLEEEGGGVSVSFMPDLYLGERCLAPKSAHLQAPSLVWPDYWPVWSML